MTAERVVLCMRWGTLYPAGYVNVLHSAVCRHLEKPFRFVCLTDESEGLNPGIEAFPIPDLGFSECHWKSGAWPKLSVFLQDLYGLQGRALFIDLDSIILGSLDPFFDFADELVAIGGGRKWRRGSENPEPELASGVFAFDLGTEPQVVEIFQKDPVGAFDEYGLEQDFLAATVSSWKPWPDDWVISFKRHLRLPPVVDWFLPQRLPPAGTGIVAFHGDPRPIDVVRQGKYYWNEFPRRGRGPIPWVRDYWLENGYKDDF